MTLLLQLASLQRPMFPISKIFLILVMVTMRLKWFIIFSLPPLLAHAILRGDGSTLTNWAKSLELPSSKTTYFNFTASHDGIGVRPATGILPDDEIKFLADTAIDHGGFVSYKNNSDGSQSPYELNCNYQDLLSSPKDSDELRFKRLMLSQIIMLSMPGVPGIYFHSLVGSRNDLEGVKVTQRNRTINREKFDFHKLQEELQQPDSPRKKSSQRILTTLNHQKKKKFASILIVHLKY